MKTIIKAILVLLPSSLLTTDDRALFFAICITWGAFCGWELWPWIDRNWGE